jgi:prevent-host-death family protein
MEAAMAAIGVRELKARASEVIRRVRERGEAVDVTHRGEVVARLVPVPRPSRRRGAATTWSTLDRVSAEISARWPRGRSAATAVREARREL